MNRYDTKNSKEMEKTWDNQAAFDALCRGMFLLGVAKLEHSWSHPHSLAKKLN